MAACPGCLLYNRKKRSCQQAPNVLSFFGFSWALLLNAVSACLRVPHHSGSEALIHPDGLSPLCYLSILMPLSSPNMSFPPAKNRLLHMESGKFISPKDHATSFGMRNKLAML